jgi:hypothetical protein
MKPAEQKRKQTMSFKNTKTTETEAKKAPVAKVRVGLISASIWENPTEKGKFYNDGEGQWQTTHSYGTGDLLELAKCADLAHTKIIEATTGGDE